jgi:AcrR family transcriptional regulator
VHATETSDGYEGILDAAEGLIRAKSAEGWTLAELAESAGVPVAAVEAKFHSEWDVFCAVIRRDEEGWEMAIREAPYESATDRIMHLLKACVPDYDWTFWIELWSLALRDERAAQLREELDQNFRALIEELVDGGVESGEFAVEDTRCVVITIATLIDTMALQATLGDTTIRPNYMLDACVSVTGTLLGKTLSLPQLESGSS